MPRTTIRIDFLKGETRRYRSVLHRPDGIDVALEGGSYNKLGPRHGAEVPHDLAHLVVEDELALTHGVWGVLVRGGLFGHAKVVAGRQGPHASAHGRAVIAEAGDRIMQAEMLTRAVCDACAGQGPSEPRAINRALGPRWSSDTLTKATLDRACARLRSASDRWANLPPGASLQETWPHGSESSRRGRGRW